VDSPNSGLGVKISADGEVSTRTRITVARSLREYGYRYLGYPVRHHSAITVHFSGVPCYSHELRSSRTSGGTTFRYFN